MLISLGNISLVFAGIVLFFQAVHYIHHDHWITFSFEILHNKLPESLHLVLHNVGLSLFFTILGVVSFAFNMTINYINERNSTSPTDNNC